MNDIIIVLSRNIKKYRNLCKMTQEELANRINMSSKYISDIERGVKEPRYQTLNMISHALGVELNVLFIDDNKQMKDSFNKKKFIINYFETLSFEDLEKVYKITSILLEK